jgi:zinc/manganese transport system permease protein
MNPSPSLNVFSDVDQLLAFAFMRSALVAGTIVAVLAAIAGWYMVLRRQSFAGHTLAVMAFPGATGAALLGVPASIGYYFACAAAALSISSSRRPRAIGLGGETATIASVQAVGLGAGFLFLSLNHSVLGTPETLLFGTFLGITQGQVVTLLVLALVLLTLFGLIGRPLLFATLDREGASAKGVPVGLLDIVFLLALGLTIAAASQITGALLVFTLLVAPPASARILTPRPGRALILSVLFGLLVVWLGLALAYFSNYPFGFYTSSLAMAIYVLARAKRKR